MTHMWNRLFIFAVLFLGVFITGNTLAANDSNKEGGIGGTGSAANTKGIGGTGAPAMNGGIGGTGLRPNDKSAMPTFAGKVLFVVGQVEAQNLGQIRSLTKGDPVRVGDTLKSSKGASLQLRMEDGGTIVLRPESQLVIEAFVYKGKQDGNEHIALALLTGGFRAVTGIIGNLHKENYSIRTPNAVIGIRGTDHETVFVARTPPGQTAVVEPGTYNHVISGATLLQSEQGKLLIKPNQTGFAALNGATPIILDRPLPIFGDPKANSEEHGEHSDNMNNSGQERKGNTGSSDAISGSEQNSRIPTSGSDQNKVTQTDRLANSSVDLSTLETDSSPAASGSAVVGAHMAAGLLAVGSAQAGSSEEKLFIENNVPTSYSNDATGFNYLANDAPPIQSGTAQVDSVNVTWGIYAGGIAFDTSGKAITINYHPFAFVDGGATSPAVIAHIGGSAAFSSSSSSMVGSTQPVTESGTLGGSVTLNVGINLGTGTLTSYNLAVKDANSRSWTGNLVSGTPVALSTFANGTPLAVTCGVCSGPANGSAAGILIGPNAKGLISSYVLSTTTGQAVAGAVVMSRP
jgi:hypothetical protein